MKKLVVCFLSLFLVFNNFGYVFAEKGNPLIEHSEYCNAIRERFEKIGNDKQVRDPQCIWEKSPTDDDHREIKVFNFPHIIKIRDNEGSFIKSSLNMFLELTEITNNMSSVIEKAGKEAGKLLRDKVYEKTKGNVDLKVIADFLGVDEETALECFMGAYGATILSKLAGSGAMATSAFFISVAIAYAHDMIFISYAHGGISAAIDLFLTTGLTPMLIITGVIVSLATTARIFTGSALIRERKANISNMLALIYSSILNDPDEVLRCNVLVTAIDKRDFNPWAPWNWISKPRNDGGFAAFDCIGNLKYAPKGNEYDRGLIRFFSELFDKITTKEHIDIEKVKRFVNSGDWPKAPQIISDL